MNHLLVPLLIDFETQAVVGIDNPDYTSDLDTKIICMSWGFYGETGYLWWAGDPLPPEIIEHVEYGGMIGASNASFDRNIWNFVGTEDHGFPKTPLEQWYCTQAQARVAGLPSALDKSARALKLATRKSSNGTKLITSCCMQPFSEDPQEYADLGAYCVQDWVVMDKVARSIPPLTKQALDDYQLNERINERGIKIDRDLAKAATQYADIELSEINAKITAVTCEGVTKSTQHRRICTWIRECLEDDGLLDAVKLMVRYKTDKETKEVKKGYSSDKTSRANLLAGHNENQFVLPEDVLDLLQLMQDAGGTAVSKFRTMGIKASLDDDRVRGVLRYAGAPSTQRFSSMGLQVHNFRRDAFSAEYAEFLKGQMLRNETLVDGSGKPLYVMDTLGRLLRSAIIPEEGKVLIVGDWNAVESRMTAWLAGDKGKLDMFARGDCPYCYEAEGIYGRPINKKDDPIERSVGKVTDLACFAADTEVLTESGWKRIVDVSQNDMLHDGVEFVAHGGLVYQGNKLTTEVDGIRVTRSHNFLMGDIWVTTDDLKENTNYLKKAHNTATSLLSVSIENCVKACHLTRSLSSKKTVKDLMVPVYDILNSGTRNRYLVRGLTGELVAHNCGFLGGEGALASMAAQFGICIPPEKRKDIVQSYRAKHPKLVAYGDDLLSAAHRAVSNPNTKQAVRNVSYYFDEDDDALYCTLPDNITVLRYPECRFEMKSVPWDETELRPTLTALKASLTPKADAKEWTRHGLWRGIFVENCAQGLCAALLKHCIRECEAQGLHVIFHVHDEIVLEVPHDKTAEAMEGLEKIMDHPPEWLDGLDLVAKPEVMLRYGK